MAELEFLLEDTPEEEILKQEVANYKEVCSVLILWKLKLMFAGVL